MNCSTSMPNNTHKTLWNEIIVGIKFDRNKNFKNSVIFGQYCEILTFNLFFSLTFQFFFHFIFHFITKIKSNSKLFNQTTNKNQLDLVCTLTTCDVYATRIQKEMNELSIGTIHVCCITNQNKAPTQANKQPILFSFPFSFIFSCKILHWMYWVRKSKRKPNHTAPLSQHAKEFTLETRDQCTKCLNSTALCYNVEFLFLFFLSFCLLFDLHINVTNTKM